MGKDARQVFRDVWDESNSELGTQTAGTASSGVYPDEKLSWEQVIRKCYDSSTNKLRIVEVS